MPEKIQFRHLPPSCCISTFGVPREGKGGTYVVNGNGAECIRVCEMVKFSTHVTHPLPESSSPRVTEIHTVMRQETMQSAMTHSFELRSIIRHRQGIPHPRERHREREIRAPAFVYARIDLYPLCPGLYACLHLRVYVCGHARLDLQSPQYRVVSVHSPRCLQPGFNQSKRGRVEQATQRLLLTN